MRKRKLITVGTLFVFAALLFFLFNRPVPPQIVGTIPPDDAKEILQVVREELRFQILPRAEDRLYFPLYTFECIREYGKQRILWIEASTNGSVNVYVAESKAALRDRGYIFSLTNSSKSTGKLPAWQINRENFIWWWFSNSAPQNLHIPP